MSGPIVKPGDRIVYAVATRGRCAELRTGPVEHVGAVSVVVRCEQLQGRRHTKPIEEVMVLTGGEVLT